MQASSQRSCYPPSLRNTSNLYVSIELCHCANHCRTCRLHTNHKYTLIIIALVVWPWFSSMWLRAGCFRWIDNTHFQNWYSHWFWHKWWWCGLGLWMTLPCCGSILMTAFTDECEDKWWTCDFRMMPSINGTSWRYMIALWLDPNNWVFDGICWVSILILGGISSWWVHVRNKF